MGKKRRLIKKSNKFGIKHFSHPLLRHLDKQTQPTQPIKVEVTRVIEKPAVEVKKVEKEIIEIKNEVKTKAKQTVTKKVTPRVKAKSKTTKRVKKTKPTTDKAI